MKFAALLAASCLALAHCAQDRIRVDEDGVLSFAKGSAVERIAARKEFAAQSAARSFARRGGARVAVRKAAQTCTAGSVTLDIGAGPQQFACDGVDFASFVPFDSLSLVNPCFADKDCVGDNVSATTNLDDVFGWVSPEGREIAIQCTSNAVWFVDASDATNPLVLGYLYTNRPLSQFCDVKVAGDTAYIVRDARKDTYDTFQRGIQVFDLKNLVCSSAYESGEPEEFVAQNEYHAFGLAANLVVDAPAQKLFAVGLEYSGYCPGVQVIDISDPLFPEFVTCVKEPGYTFDATCLQYNGPDASYQGIELCITYSEGAVALLDLTNPVAPSVLSAIFVDNLKSGTLSADLKTLFVSAAATSEDSNNVTHTVLKAYDITDLENPADLVDFVQPAEADQGNVFNWGLLHKAGLAGNPALANGPDANFLYLSAFAEGLLVLDVSNAAAGITVAGSFDVFPDDDEAGEIGTGSNYMFPSGTLAVSDFLGGLWFLKPQMAYAGAAPAVNVVPTSNCPTKYPTLSPTTPTTHSPTLDCHDNIPSGLVYTSTGEEAPCFEIVAFCGQVDIVDNACRFSCNRCDITDSPTFGFHTFAPTPAPVGTTPPVGGGGPCADLANPGLYFTDGAPAMCYQVADYCAKQQVVRDRCPGVCGSCNKALDAVTLPENPMAEESSVDYMLVFLMVVTAGITVVLCLSAFTAVMQIRRA